MMERALVTGGCGFIGSNLAEELLKRGFSVRVLDNMSTGKKENIRPFADNVELIEGSITDTAVVMEACKGVSYVFHQAALPSVPRSIENPALSNDVNINGTLNLLMASKKHKVKRFIYASSSSAYGNSPALPKKEDMKPEPLSPYAVTKLAAEHYCKVFYSVYGLETVCLRYFNVFGPNQDPDSEYSAVIPKFIKKALNGERPVIFGNGEITRDFTFVANVVEANILAMSAENAAGQVFNIATGKRISLNELAKKIIKLSGNSFEPIYAEERKGDVKHSLADISKAEALLGYKPRVDFEEGIKITFEWYRKKLGRC